MARAFGNDYFHAFRFKVFAKYADGSDVFEAAAGFNSCTIPEMSVEVAEYREGNMLYTIKQPGIPTVSTVTLSRGIVKKDTRLFEAIKRAIEGNPAPEYRFDLVIEHYHREDDIKSGKATRKYILREAFVSRAKPAGDLDASSSDISIQEVDIEGERLDIEVEGSSITA